MKKENENQEELNEQNVAAEENITENAENAQPQEAAETEEAVDPLTKTQQELDEAKKQLLYKIAEFDNYRKHAIKEKSELILNGGAKTIEALLPIVDDMERAIENQNKTDDINAVREGIEMIFQKLQKTLQQMGVTKIETEGKAFNTDFHEAIAVVPGMGEDKKNQIIDCVQAGYMLNDRVLRHAKVAVGA